MVCGKMGERKSAGKWSKETVLGLGAQDENELYCEKADLTLEDEEKKTILLADMARPNEANRQVKPEEKIKKYEQLCFELRERREGYTVKVIPIAIECLDRGMKELKTDMQKIFEYENEKELYTTMREMQKTVLWESESMIRNVLSGLLI